MYKLSSIILITVLVKTVHLSKNVILFLE